MNGKKCVDLKCAEPGIRRGNADFRGNENRKSRKKCFDRGKKIREKEKQKRQPRSGRQWSRRLLGSFSPKVKSVHAMHCGLQRWRKRKISHVGKFSMIQRQKTVGNRPSCQSGWIPKSEVSEPSCVNLFPRSYQSFDSTPSRSSGCELSEAPTPVRERMHKICTHAPSHLSEEKADIKKNNNNKIANSIALHILTRVID